MSEKVKWTEADEVMAHAELARERMVTPNNLLWVSRLIATARQQEREACAEIVGRRAEDFWSAATGVFKAQISEMLTDLAAAIRARK